MRKHECRLVPRLLLPRWTRKNHAENMLRFCREIGADEMMVFPVSQFIAANPPFTDKTLHKEAQKTAKLRMLAARQGINVFINHFFFMGEDLAQDNPRKRQFPWAVDITGQEAKGYRCILAQETKDAAAKELVALASSGVDKIFQDDEVHYDWKPVATCNEALHFCFCDDHIRAFSQRIGKKIGREELVRRLQSDRPADVAIRSEWLAFKRDTFLDFVNYCRRKVHQKYPHVRLGQMTTFTHLTAWDGITFAEHLKAWAGDLRPLCRPAQGWYGDHIRTGLPMAIAQTMWTMHCLPENTEVYSEVDWGAPWTQFDSSARMSADLQIKVNLLLNIKTHSLLYLGEGPEDKFIQARLIRQIKKSRAVFDGLAKHLPEKARRTGVQFYMAEKMGLAYPLKRRGREGDLADPYALTGEGWGLPPWMKAFRCLARSGVAMTFDESPVAVLTGGMASLFKDKIKTILETKNLIIDAGAVQDLKAMGLLKQFGLEPAKEYKLTRNERLTHDAFNGVAKDEMVPTGRVIPPERVVPLKTIKQKTVTHRVLSEIIDCNLQVHGAGIVLCERVDTGTRLCALSYHLSDENAWGFGIRKQQWRHILDWLGGRKFKQSVWIDDACDVWPISYKLDGDNRTWVGLINFGHDEVNDATCWISQSGKVRVHFINTKGQMQKISKKYIRNTNGKIGITLSGEHAVKALDVQMFIIEPI